MGRGQAIIIAIRLRSATGQPAIGPSGVVRQSKAAISCPTALPPAVRKSSWGVC